MSRLPRPIFVECKLDEVLVRALGIPRRRIRHQGSKGDICKQLIRALAESEALRFLREQLG